MAVDRQKTSKPTAKSDFSNQCTLDHQSLKQAFFQAFDPSLLRQYCMKLFEQPDTWPKQAIAGGTHFYCFKLAKPGLAMDIAVKVPTKAFDEKHAKNLKRALSKVSSYREPSLLPPFQFVDCGDKFAIAMPFAPQEAKQTKEDWQPLSLWVSQLHELLASRGLEINDLIQIRCWRGIPFLIDFSDLRNLEGRSS